MKTLLFVSRAEIMKPYKDFVAYHYVIVASSHVFCMCDDDEVFFFFCRLMYVRLGIKQTENLKINKRNR